MSTQITIKERGGSRDILAEGTTREDIERQIRRTYGRQAFLERSGAGPVGANLWEGMILRQVGRGADYSVLANVLIHEVPR